MSGKLLNVPERADIPENIKEQLIKVSCILSSKIKYMAILAFQKPDSNHA